jgi:hypothetical protein
MYHMVANLLVELVAYHKHLNWSANAEALLIQQPETVIERVAHRFLALESQVWCAS